MYVAKFRRYVNRRELAVSPKRSLKVLRVLLVPVTMIFRYQGLSFVDQ